jgi:catechol 2,3-dioxygenase-like lactoylglutathione lyase family enzyme
MPTPNYLLVAVKNPSRSAALYDRLLGQKPVENSETFVLYVLPNGLKLGLWQASTMEPKPTQAGGVEIAFGLDSRDAVLRAYDEWRQLGLTVVQEPTDMDFGFTFVVEDPDGHRLRPFVLAVNPR